MSAARATAQRHFDDGRASGDALTQALATALTARIKAQRHFDTALRILAERAAHYEARRMGR